MPSNVSRLSMNSYTFAKNTNNELMTGYIKKLYKHMPSSISQGAAPLKEVNPPQNKPKLMRKDSKKKLKGMTTQNFKTMPTASSPTSVLLGKTKALRSCSPMIRFYNTRRYNSSASISSTAIVSKRYNTKPRKRVSQPKKATDNACGGDLMDVDMTVKQLISLGPQRSFMSGAHKRSSADPMSGWHHPPDISMLEDAPRANKAAATRHSSLARPVEMRQTRRASQAHPQDKPSTMKPYHWPAASPDHMPPIKKTQSSLDVCMKHGEGQLKNLRNPKTAERVSYNDSNVSNQERHTQLLLQKTKMLQDLLKQKNEQHQQVAKNKPAKSAAKRSSSQIQQHQNQQQQRGAERRYLPLDYQRAEEMRQKQQREANAKLRQSIDAMAHLDINTSGALAVPAKLVKNPAQTSLYDLLVGNGRKHKTRQQEDRLQKQYTSNYVWQRHVLNTNKDKLTGDHEDAYGEKENEDERAGNAAREQEGGSGILFRKPGYEITTPTASAIKMANQQKASKGQKESPLQRHWVNLHYPRYKTSSMGLDPNTHVSNRRAALNSAHTTTEIEPDPEIKEEYNSAVQSAYQKISENSLENFIKKHAESCKHLTGSRRRF